MYCANKFNNSYQYLLKTDDFPYKENITKFPQMIVTYLNQITKDSDLEQSKRVVAKIKGMFRSGKKSPV